MRLRDPRSLLLLLLTATLIGATATTAEAQSRKSPFVAGGLSFLLPGTGQFYNGQWGKGGLMMGGAVVASGMVASGIICADNSNDCAQLNVGAAALVGIWVWSMIDGARDTGIWRRIRVVKWENTFVGGDEDQDLKDILAAEASGILRWLVEGCLEWQEHGLAEPSPG